MISRSLKLFFLASIFGAIAITLVGGWFTMESAPPYPEKIFTGDGSILTTKSDILDGQEVWQKYGLMDLGSVWGTVPFYTYSAIAIVSFFAFGLFYTPRTLNYVSVYSSSCRFSSDLGFL